MVSTSSSLTDAQKQRMEAKRQAALELRAARALAPAALNHQVPASWQPAVPRWGAGAAPQPVQTCAPSHAAAAPLQAMPWRALPSHAAATASLLKPLPPAAAPEQPPSSDAPRSACPPARLPPPGSPLPPGQHWQQRPPPPPLPAPIAAPAAPAARLPACAVGLNDAQAAAVLAPPHEPLAVLAGAGAGKTTVMVRRIAHTLASGVEPDRVLAITFTRAAADEMGSRLRAMGIATAAAGGARGVHVSTFHSFCLRLCTRHARQLPGGAYADGFTLVSGERVRAAVKRACAALAESSLDRGAGGGGRDGDDGGAEGGRPELDAKRGALGIARARALGVHTGDGPLPAELPGGGGDGGGRRPQQPSELVPPLLLRAYERALLDDCAMDFADLVRVATALLEGVPAVGDAVRAERSHVLVDEFQDCSAAQLALLFALAPPPSAALTVVGDDDQSIYGFQGANGSAAFAEFRRLYGGPAGARVVALSQNYRSSANIVRAAAALIARNDAAAVDAAAAVSTADGERAGRGLSGGTVGRQPKPPPWTSAAAGARVRVTACRTVTVEAVHVARCICRLVRDEGVRYGEIAVLARTARAAAPTHAALRAARVPVAAARANIFALKCTQQLLALLRLVAAARRAPQHERPFALVCGAGAAAGAAGSERAPPRAPKLDADWLCLLKAFQPAPQDGAAGAGSHRVPSGRGGGRGDGRGDGRGGRGGAEPTERTAVQVAHAFAARWRCSLGEAIAELAAAREASDAAARAAKVEGGGGKRRRGASATVEAASRDADGADGVADARADDRAAARAAAARAALVGMRVAHTSTLCSAVGAVAMLRERVATLKLDGLLTRATTALPGSGRFHCKPSRAAAGDSCAAPAPSGARGGAQQQPRALGGPRAVAAAARSASLAASVERGSADGVHHSNKGGGSGGARGGGAAAARTAGLLLEDGDERSVLQRLLAGTAADPCTASDLQAPRAATVGSELAMRDGSGGDDARLQRLRALLEELARREAEAEAEEVALAADSVLLSTIHGAKGLEWRVVFIVRACEGELPTTQRAGDAASHDEEERRLCYVAVTRARELLHVSYAEKDDGPNGESHCRSRFIDELAGASGALAPTETVDELEADGDEALWPP